MSSKYDVAAYIWPAYTGQERRTHIFWPEGIGEWQTVRNSKPKSNGYSWNRQPLWGFQDEADPAVMEMQIENAVKYGVNVFAYDWYWYDRRPFLENCLNDGFLKARNCHRMKFYLMWANHDATQLWDIRNSSDEDTVVWSGQVDRPAFETMALRLIEKYFTHPQYLRIDGKPLFCIYDLRNFVEGLGGTEAARAAIDWFREACRQAGLPGFHLQIILQSPCVANMSGIDKERLLLTPELAEHLTVDSVTHYQYVHFTNINRPYPDVMKDVLAQWKELKRSFRIPYFPHVSLGWDNNPRFIEFREGIMQDTTPENIRYALQCAKEYIDEQADLYPLVTINSWNEWTETSYLLPDNVNGCGYLQAVQDVFSRKRGEQHPLKTDESFSAPPSEVSDLTQSYAAVLRG